MTGNKLPIEQISKLADDVRLIKDFAENHNFDTSLLTANVTPATNTDKKYDLSLISMGLFILLVLFSIAMIKLWKPPLSASESGFMFILGLVFSIIASIAAHIRFQDKIVTSIVVLGLLLVLFIGAGIFTPEEAVSKVGEFAKEKY